MTFNEAFSEIPIMFYVTLVLLPIMIAVYFTAGRQRRAVPLSSVDPAQVLNANSINVKRVLISNILLGMVLGLGISLFIFITMIGVDWYNATGLFAVSLPFNTYPPHATDVLPPHPPSYTKNSSDTGGTNGDSNSQTDNKSPSGGN